jgi:radical SAM protein with 4Fe4S-binding SPASM domain
MSDITDHIVAAGLHAPEELTLMVTDGCNLACRHCWLECRRLPLAAPVRLAVLERVISNFIDLGGKRITLTGGEFFSHPDWKDLLHFTGRQSGLQGVCLQTNATLLTEHHIQTLLDLPLDRLSIQVSLDGARAETHDRIRGQGTFQAALKSIRRLIHSGLGDNLQVAFTEMRHNVTDLPRLLEMVDNLGIGRLTAGTIVCGGRAARGISCQLPEPFQYGDLLQLYNQDDRFRRRYDRIGNFPAIEWLKGRSQPAGQVCTCIRNLFVDAGGDLFPCCMMRHPGFAQPDAHRLPLVDAIYRALPLWRQLPEIDRRRRSQLQACQACPGRLHCGGGCMGRAYAAGGDLLQPEDRCGLRRAVYSYNC